MGHDIRIKLLLAFSYLLILFVTLGFVSYNQFRNVSHALQTPVMSLPASDNNEPHVSANSFPEVQRILNDHFSTIFHLIVLGLLSSLVIIVMVMRHIAQPIDRINEIIESNDMENWRIYEGFNQATASRNAALDKLSDTEERNRIIIQSAPYAIIAMNREGLIKDWNDQAKNIFGWEKQKILNRNMAELIISGQDRDLFAKEFNRYFENPNVTFSGNKIELMAIKNGGAEIPVEMHISFSGTNEDSVVSVFIQDISQQKNTLKSLRIYRELVNESEEMMAYLNQELVYSAINKLHSMFFNKDESEILGKTGENLFGQTVYNNVFRPAFMRCLSGKEVELTDHIEVPGRGIHAIKMHLYPFRDESGNVNGIVQVMSEVAA